jgi:hypothetical protein
MQLSEHALANAMGFISLEFVARFDIELSIPSFVGNSLRSSLVDLLQQYVEQSRYVRDFQVCNYQVYELVSRNHGPEAWLTLRNWISSVYLAAGNDRTSERVWTLILSKGCSGECTPDDRPLEDLWRIWRKVSLAQDATSIRLSDEKVKPIGEWDNQMLPLIYSDIENICDSVLLMHTFNKVVEEWQPFTVEQLTRIHVWGKRVAAELGIREANVTFPGAWQYASQFSGASTTPFWRGQPE